MKNIIAIVRPARVKLDRHRAAAILGRGHRAVSVHDGWSIRHGRERAAVGARRSALDRAGRDAMRELARVGR